MRGQIPQMDPWITKVVNFQYGSNFHPIFYNNIILLLGSTYTHTLYSLLLSLSVSPFLHIGDSPSKEIN